jgi:uncharacterized membrane protein YczE
MRAMLIKRLIQLHLGLAAYGVSLALMVRANLGLDPWDVFHQGLSDRIGLSFGMTVNLVGLLVLLAWWPIKQKPGIGTVMNVLLIGTVADLTLLVVPELHSYTLRAVLLVSAIGLNGLATASYIGAGLGPGPRDGLMTGLCWRAVSCWAARWALARCSMRSPSGRWCTGCCRASP